jgi:hypothetical protein
MASIFADGVEINIEEGHWRLYNLEGANSLSPFFDSVKGKGLLNYVSAFADARQLPGTVLASDYVRAVIAGYDEKRSRWVLGLHVQINVMDTPRFIQMVQWPLGDDDAHGAASHQAGRILAEYIGCPLKLFGPKKTPLARADGVYGPGGIDPLEVSHKTDTLEKHRVQFKAELLELPISGYGIWVGGNRHSVTVKLSKDAEQTAANGTMTKYRQVSVEKDGKLVRLVGQSGIFGALLSNERIFESDEVENIELRHTVVHNSSMQKDEDGFDLDVTTTHHMYGVYLNIEDESILLAQVAHIKQSEMVLHRVKTGVNAVGKDSYDPGKEMAYLRFHQKDQQKHDAKADFIESVSVILASALGRSVVKTEIGDQPM